MSVGERGPSLTGSHDGGQYCGRSRERISQRIRGGVLTIICVHLLTHKWCKQTGEGERGAGTGKHVKTKCTIGVQLETASYVSKNVSCENRHTGAPSRTWSLGTKVSPAQKHILQ